MNSLLSTLIVCITITATGWHFGAKIFDEMDRPTAPKSIQLREGNSRHDQELKSLLAML
jgi:hypothetical protein